MICAPQLMSADNLTAAQIGTARVLPALFHHSVTRRAAVDRRGQMLAADSAQRDWPGGRRRAARGPAAQRPRPQGVDPYRDGSQLLGAYRDGRARIVIGRASDYYGPRGTGSTAGETLFGRILAGKKPLWTGRLDQPHTFHFLPDIARGLLVLADRPAADGQIWHLPTAEPLAAQQFFDTVAEAAGNQCRSGARCRAGAARGRGHLLAAAQGDARRPTSSRRPSLSTRASSKPPSAASTRHRTATP